MVDLAESVFGVRNRKNSVHLKELQKFCRLVVIIGAYGHVGAYESKFKGFKAKNGESSRGRNF